MKSIPSPRQTLVGSITVLELLGETSYVQLRVGAQTLVHRDIALGVDSLVRNSIQHAPPRPIEIEHAIELTEDVVMPLADQFVGSNGLEMQGVGAVLIAQTLGAVGIGQSLLTIEEVEALFNRLAAVSEGRPHSQEALPTDAQFFAAMLILREFMHHLKFTTVSLQTTRDPI